MRVAVVINTSWNIWNFRRGLVKALQAAGHEVLAIAPPDAYSARLESELGCRYVPILMENKGTNPLKDAQLTRRFLTIYKRERPDVVLHFTIKPNIYGTLAAKLAGVASINNVSGLGTVFLIENLVSKVARGLYRLAFRFPHKVFFQNNDDRELFIRYGLIRPERTGLVPGSGVDLARFRPQPSADKAANAPFTFLMVARVLYEKGIVEYFEAARQLRTTLGPDQVRVQLLGGLDEAGGVGVPRATFEQWLAEGHVEHLGTSDNVAEHLHRADCVVLPSYREGTPKTLLEAAACGKPLVTTDVPGCRETVEHGRNGYLCQVRSADDLAAKLLLVAQLAPERLAAMGAASRQLAEEKFDEQLVLREYLTAVAEASRQSPIKMH
ncbi:glycosyltransferase family 4 protein [Siccationidurans sp. BT559]|uniref:glycosyltransferase family 4 protein n=1 Tax=Hymenobacter sp. BT559 TaxID=2795729 RepID=UPI0018ED02C6|nr:glycosyltransferase family 4 protein [Hymenobacter sp. BT559]